MVCYDYNVEDIVYDIKSEECTVTAKVVAAINKDNYKKELMPVFNYLMSRGTNLRDLLRRQMEFVVTVQCNRPCNYTDEKGMLVAQSALNQDIMKYNRHINTVLKQKLTEIAKADIAVFESAEHYFNVNIQDMKKKGRIVQECVVTSGYIDTLPFV